MLDLERQPQNSTYVKEILFNPWFFLDIVIGHVIRGGGALVLGQEQDTEGGSFDANQNFIGEMTGVNVWDHVIKDQEIMRMSKLCLTGEGNLYQWRDFKAHVKGSVQII